MAAFRKAILRAGKYHSPDGVVEVTPERLRHWELQFRRLRAARQVVPVDWDHADDPAKMQPLSVDAYKRRSAANTVGHLRDFRVGDDGQSAEITLDLRTQRAIEAAETNAVYVSPVLFPEWRDGSGQRYTDVITHVDMVNHPVDHSQGSFVPTTEAPAIACALRMALSAPYRFGGPTMADDDKKPDEIPTDDGADDAAPPDDAADDSADDAAPPDTGADDSTLSSVIEQLAKFNIVLQDGTTAENLLDRLHTALLTAAAHQGIDDDGTDDNAGGNPADQPTVAAPDVATMSLEARAALNWAEGQHREALGKRLDALVETGRCTPAEAKARRQALETVRLSLDKAGKPIASRLEEWVDSREAIPSGACWSREQRLSADRQRSIQDPPAGMVGELTTAEIDNAVNFALGRKKQLA